jgi:adenine-specific DNA-methyltransferase
LYPVRPHGLLAHPRAQKSNWKAIELLFQLTDEELSRNATLFKDTAVRASLLQSYVFFAVELQPGDYARGKLAAITRQINRIFPMPVMVLFKVGAICPSPSSTAGRTSVMKAKMSWARSR